MNGFHPDLIAGRDLPRNPVRAEDLPAIQAMAPVGVPAPPDVAITNLTAPGLRGAPPVGLRLYSPVADAIAPRPMLFWIHGGGFLGGSPESDDQVMISIVRRLDIAVVSLRYRLAPSHPAPAALDDAYSGLAWTFAHATENGWDGERIAIGGGSAGGGLAASLVQLTHDLGELHPVFQLLFEPMLDDRTAVRTDIDTTYVRGWEAESNHFAWGAYLGQPAGLPEAPPYVVPSRRTDLSGLPPAWIGVGTIDLFHDEDLEYARRLLDAGVACETAVVPGAFHGFESLFPDAPVSVAFLDDALRALAAALSIPPID